MSYLSSDELGKQIQLALTRVVEEVITEELKQLHDRIEQRARGQIGQLVTRVFSTMTWERMRNDLVIKVQIEKPE